MTPHIFVWDAAWWKILLLIPGITGWEKQEHGRWSQRWGFLSAISCRDLGETPPSSPLWNERWWCIISKELSSMTCLGLWSLGRRGGGGHGFCYWCAKSGVCFGIRIGGIPAWESVQSTEVRFLCDCWGWWCFGGSGSRLSGEIMMSIWVLCCVPWIEFHLIQNCRLCFLFGTLRSESGALSFWETGQNVDDSFNMPLDQARGQEFWVILLMGKGEDCLLWSHVGCRAPVFQVILGFK